ncbi:hypothetical protein EVAR_43420_1 [Eumeta japonica]|uniref:Uncharacterized protein n=1 Tax=Eumeta variegata TaxID=151549 RepID=A0A4C1WT52_EUMVA|nr:hypothetical protein EVAR_43420_1 [Eumeta japonica]
MPRCPPCGIHRAITRRRHPMPIGRDRRSPQSSNLLGLRITANQQVASGVFWSVRVGHSPRTRFKAYVGNHRPAGRIRPDERLDPARETF